jgi:hypothetical protein
VLLEDLGVLLERLVGAHEDDAQLGQLFLDRVVDDLGVVLRADAGQELRSASGMPSRSNVSLICPARRPTTLLALRRLAVVDDLVEVDVAQVAAPRWHRPLEEVLVGAQAELEHPVRLALERADLLDRVARQAALGLVEVDELVLEVELRAVVVDHLSLVRVMRLGRRVVLLILT